MSGSAATFIFCILLDMPSYNASILLLHFILLQKPVLVTCSFPSLSWSSHASELMFVFDMAAKRCCCPHKKGHHGTTSFFCFINFKTFLGASWVHINSSRVWETRNSRKEHYFVSYYLFSLINTRLK